MLHKFYCLRILFTLMVFNVFTTPFFDLLNYKKNLGLKRNIFPFRFDSQNYLSSSRAILCQGKEQRASILNGIPDETNLKLRIEKRQGEFEERREREMEHC